MEQSDYELAATDRQVGSERSTTRFPGDGPWYQVSSHVPTASELVTTLEAMREAGWITTAIARSDIREGA